MENNIQIFDDQASMEAALAERAANGGNEGDAGKGGAGEVAGAGGAGKNTNSPGGEFNEAEYLTRTFGEGFNSVDAIRNRLNAPIDEEVQKVWPKVKSLIEKPGILNLMEIADREPDRLPTYFAATKYDIDNMSEVDKVVAHMVLEDNLDEQTARTWAQNAFKLGEDFEDASDAEKASAKVELVRAAKKADSFLREFQEKATIPTPPKEVGAANDEKTAKAIEERRQSWKPELEKLQADFVVSNEQEFDYHGEKIPVKFNYTVTDEDRKQYRGILDSIVNNGAFELNDDNRAAIVAAARSSFIEKNFDKIAKSIGHSVLSSFHEVTGHKFYGKPPRRTDEQPPAPGSEKEGRASQPLKVGF